MKKERKMWTKDEINLLLTLWNTNALEQIADKIGVERKQVVNVAAQIRKAGYALPKKHKIGYMRNLIKEVLLEQKLIRK